MDFDYQSMETDARALLHEWVQSESLRKHCEAVAASMRYMARKAGEDEALWFATGLLHDLDYELWPNLELSETGHPFVGVRHLCEQGWPDTITRAILSHADYSGVARESAMEHTLFAVDELSSFVVAVALVRPSRAIRDVEVKSVRKKLRDRDFAAKVSRADIQQGADELGITQDQLIADVIAALTLEAERLGLEGAAA